MPCILARPDDISSSSSVRARMLPVGDNECPEMGGTKDETRKFLAMPNNFGTKIFLVF